MKKGKIVMKYSKPMVEQIASFKNDTRGLLEHGRIVGKGTHLELLNTVPLYKELAKEQMLI